MNATLQRADGLFIDKDLNKIELDALLVVNLHKAPHGVLQQRLLLVLLKGAMYARRRPAGTGLREDELHCHVAQFESLLLQVLVHKQSESVDPQPFKEHHLLILKPPDVIHGSDQWTRQAQAHRSSLAESRTSGTYLHP